MDGIHKPQLYVSSYLANSKQKYLIKVENLVNITDIKACWTAKIVCRVQCFFKWEHLCIFKSYILRYLYFEREYIYRPHLSSVPESYGSIIRVSKCWLGGCLTTHRVSMFCFTLTWEFNYQFSCQSRCLITRRSQRCAWAVGNFSIRTLQAPEQHLAANQEAMTIVYTE